MNIAAFISVEDYLHRVDKPNAEYLDGVVRPKPMPTGYHALLCFFLLQMLRQQGIKAAAEATVRISPTKYLVPDVIAAPRIDLSYQTEPVTICVEILSPEDRLSATLNKCALYHDWGVPFCWVIDPLRRVAWNYARHSDPEEIASDGTLTADNIRISLSELFARVDEG